MSIDTHSVDSISPDHQVGTFAGGCFWCIESGFDSIEGVQSTTVGFAGGEEEDPTYLQVASGHTGHAEAVQVVYDPNVSSYQDLLDLFWQYIDPTDAGGQYVDRGPQYRTIIFYHDQIQQELAQHSKQAIAKQYEQPIATTIEPYQKFYPADKKHQKFYRKHPRRYQIYKKFSGRPPMD